MEIIYLLLLVGAGVSFGVGAFNPSAARFNLVAFGLLLWVSTEILRALMLGVEV